MGRHVAGLTTFAWMQFVAKGKAFRAWREHVRGVRVLERVKVLLSRERAKVQRISRTMDAQRTTMLQCIAASNHRMRSRLYLARAVSLSLIHI